MVKVETVKFDHPLSSTGLAHPNIPQALNSWKEIGSDSHVGRIGHSDVPAEILAMLCAPPGVAGMTLSGTSTSTAERERAVKAVASDLSRTVARLHVAQLTAEYHRGRPVVGTGGDASSCSADDGGNILCKTTLKTSVLVGLPGSGVLSLVAAVLRFSSGEVDWTPVVFVSARQGVDELELGKAIE